MTQAEALDILKLGVNVFLTGEAGSGKTYLLKQYIKYLKKNNIHVAVTAPTGVAATHLNGRTIHSWCGMGINEQLTDAQMERLMQKDELVAKIRETKVLIIDEVSMLNASRLDLVNQICQAARQDLHPFGGMQVVLCGDFFQLPPVAKKDDDGRLAVESRVWDRQSFRVCYLHEQHRQGSGKLLDVLTDIRSGQVSDQTKSLLRSRMYKEVGKNEVEAANLYTHKKDVSFYNNNELSRLKSKEAKFLMTEDGPKKLIKELKNSCLAEEKLVLKKGAIVMFVKNNFNKHYVNGTVGKVTGFEKESGFPIVKVGDGSKIVAEPEKWTIEEGRAVLATVRQVPLILAWAVTVHKSQGMSLDYVTMDLSKTFEYGMGYVALSRARSLEGLSLEGLNDKATQVSPAVRKLDQTMMELSDFALEKIKEQDPGKVKRFHQQFVEENKGEAENEPKELNF